jgi:hypothetical protein
MNGSHVVAANGEQRGSDGSQFTGSPTATDVVERPESGLIRSLAVRDSGK